jgi:acyl-CoA thioesterase
MHIMPDPNAPSAPLINFLLKEADRKIPFWSTIGMEVVDAKPGWARVRVRFSQHLINANGVMHGGVVFSAADAATAVALLSLLAEGERIATTEFKINFIKPVAEFDIIAEALILHRGRHTAVGDVTVTDAAGNLVAKALTTYAITRITEKKPGSRTAERQKKES